MIKGSRLPDDWQPSEALKAWGRAKRPDLDINEQTEAFKDFFAAKTGQDATKLNWDAAYRNWIRNAWVRSGQPRNAAQPLSGAKPLYKPEPRERTTGMPVEAQQLFKHLGIK